MENTYVFSKHFHFDFGKMPDNYKDMVYEEILSILAMGNMFTRSLLYLDFFFSLITMSG